MKFKTLDGYEVSINLSKDKCKQHDNYSAGQIHIRNLIQEIYPHVSILEDFIIPSERLSLDFFLPERKIAIEFNGEQHKRFSTFFHRDRNDFLNQVSRDKRKQQWCKINNITLVIVEDKQIQKSNLMEMIISAIHKQNNS